MKSVLLLVCVLCVAVSVSYQDDRSSHTNNWAVLVSRQVVFY